MQRCRRAPTAGARRQRVPKACPREEPSAGASRDNGTTPDQMTQTATRVCTGGSP